MYLKRLSSKLYESLSKSLNYSWTRKNEKQYVDARLELLDKQYFLEVHQQLWQSYVNIGLQKRIWPVSVFIRVLILSSIKHLFCLFKDQLYKMAKSNDFELCHRYIQNHMKHIQQDLSVCEIELRKLSQSCPIATLTIDHIDHCLKAFVIDQRAYLLERNQRDMMHFQNDVTENELYHIVFNNHLIKKHVSFNNQN